MLRKLFPLAAMWATVTITISDPVYQQVLDNVAIQTNYPALVPDPQNPGQFIPNPIDKATNLRNAVITFINETAQSGYINSQQSQNRTIVTQTAAQLFNSTNVSAK